MRCHGRELVPQARIGQHPPFRNMLLTERHHPYFGRVNPGVLCAKKCNHDCTVFVSFPAPTSSTGHTAADVDRMAAPMARQINDATHYTTDYAGKTQPHMKNLFRLLQQGQENLEQQFRSNPELREKGPGYAVLRLVQCNLTC